MYSLLAKITAALTFSKRQNLDRLKQTRFNEQDQETPDSLVRARAGLGGRFKKSLAAAKVAGENSGEASLRQWSRQVQNQQGTRQYCFIDQHGRIKVS